MGIEKVSCVEDFVRWRVVKSRLNCIKNIGNIIQSCVYCGKCSLLTLMFERQEFRIMLSVFTGKWPGSELLWARATRLHSFGRIKNKPATTWQGVFRENT